MNEYLHYNPEEKSKKELKTNVEAFLSLPEKVKQENSESNLAKQLGSFLVDKGYIQDIDTWNSWGFKYENKKISIAKDAMPDNAYNYYTFRLGKNSQGESIFPKQGDEINVYRFIHETSHAYQDYLVKKDNVANWHDKAIKGEVESTLAILFRYCYNKRKNHPGQGLSTWGNVPDYNSIQDAKSQNAIRAIEDANELITMYLWNPKYLKTYLNYLSKNINGYGEREINQDNLTIISNNEKESLEEIVGMYIDEMKENIK